MGIPGIYGEIGPGERVALSKLAIEKFEQTSRPLRVAIDISIWQFQIQAGQGGTNPAIRTLYYRLLRLLSVSVQPLFVFDGPHKPPFKRNKKTGQHGAMVPNILTKQLLTLFGFPFHIAPGEAEAECALLQREGIVDAVLSEDVDTLMFGCGLTFRNWSSEGTRGYKPPTHVSVYDSEKTKQGKSGLDREGMVLVALMSGGDYITQGIPGCGIKVACEAARAGFGKSLCRLSNSDAPAFEMWRKNLAHEVQTNEGKHFRVRHKVLKIPDTFPDTEVLGYYTHPVVSSSSKLQKLKDDVTWDKEVDVQGLRLFVAEAFDWTHKIGAKKFIRGLAPVLLVHKLRLRADRRDSGHGDLILTAMNEMDLVRTICGKRTHITSDGIPELRVIYRPLDIVSIDLDSEDSDSEDFGRDGLAPVNDDDQIESYQSDNENPRARSGSPTKRTPSAYDPTELEKIWIPETIAKIGVPLKVEDYEASGRDSKNIPKKIPKAKATTKKVTAKGAVSRGGVMDRFVKVSKPGSESKILSASMVSETTHKDLDQPLTQQSSSSIKSVRATRSTRISAAQNEKPASTAAATRTRRKVPAKDKPQTCSNPWTLSNPNSSPTASPTITKFLKQSTKPRASKKKNTPSIAADDSRGPGQRYPPASPRNNSPPILPGSLDRRPKLPSPTLPSVVQNIDLSSSININSIPLESNTTRTPPSSPPEPCSPIRRTNAATSRSPSSHAARGKEKEVISLPSSPAPAPTSPPVPCSNPLQDIGQNRVVSSDLGQTTSPTDKHPRGPKKDKGRKLLMLRDSLPGAWKAVEEGEAERKLKGRARTWRMSEVEVLDMCND